MHQWIHEIQKLTDISKYSWSWNLLSFQVCSLVKLVPHRCSRKSCRICIRLDPLLFLFTNFCIVERNYGTAFTMILGPSLQNLTFNTHLSFSFVQLKPQIAEDHLIIQSKQLRHCKMASLWNISTVAFLILQIIEICMQQ